MTDESIIQGQEEQRMRRGLAIGLIPTAIILLCGVWLSLGGSVGGFQVSAPIVWASAALALGCAVPHAVVVLWLDRYEAEPWRLILTALLWGGSVAGPAALFINGGVLWFAMDTDTHPWWMSQIVAPVAEESVKAMVLIALLRLHRAHVDGVLDGLVYGALVGLGFAVIENTLYYLQNSEVEAVFLHSLARGIIAGAGSHPCFTALVGAGLGGHLMDQTGSSRTRVFAGWGVAVVAHMLWNSLTARFLTGSLYLDLTLFLPLAVATLQLPFLTIVLAIAVAAGRHERQVIALYLAGENIQKDEVERLCSTVGAARCYVSLLARGEVRQCVRDYRRGRLLVRLAFEKWHGESESGVDPRKAIQHKQRERVLRTLLENQPS